MDKSHKRLRGILFVCTGNICRSPMAAGLLTEHVGPGSRYRIQSAGTRGLDGQRAHPLAVEEMRKRGVDLSAHRARTVTPYLLAASDLILTMEQEHKLWIEAKMPAVRNRIYLLGHWQDMEIRDPIYGGRADFERVADQVELFLLDWRLSQIQVAVRPQRHRSEARRRQRITAE